MDPFIIAAIAATIFLALVLFLLERSADQKTQIAQLKERNSGLIAERSQLHDRIQSCDRKLRIAENEMKEALQSAASMAQVLQDDLMDFDEGDAGSLIQDMQSILGEMRQSAKARKSRYYEEAITDMSLMLADIEVNGDDNDAVDALEAYVAKLADRFAVSKDVVEDTFVAGNTIIGPMSDSISTAIIDDSLSTTITNADHSVLAD